MLMFIDICVQDPLNEGAWWHSACDTATSHLWVSQRLRLHRRGLDNIQENNFNTGTLPDGVCGGCDAGDQHHSKPWCHRCKVCSMFII